MEEFEIGDIIVAKVTIGKKINSSEYLPVVTEGDIGQIKQINTRQIYLGFVTKFYLVHLQNGETFSFQASEMRRPTPAEIIHKRLDKLKIT